MGLRGNIQCYAITCLKGEELTLSIFQEYRDEMNHIFSRYIYRGFVDFRKCNCLAFDMIKLIEKATEELPKLGEYKELFDLVNKGFLKWGKTDKDDSNGETQDFVWHVTKAWDVVYEADGSMPHVKMYEWFEKHLDGSVIDYMEDQLYEYLVSHFKEPRLLERKYDLLSAKIEDAEKKKRDRYFEFVAERCRLYLLIVMADMKRPIEEIRKYAKTVRAFGKDETMAEIERTYGNMDEAVSIYSELAEKEDASNYPRDNWHIKLMDIYKEMGNKVKYHKELVAAMKYDVGDEDLWHEYRNEFSENEWSKACEAIFSDVKSDDHRVFPWYALEGRYDLMMNALEEKFRSDPFKTYEKKLKALYPDRCLKLLVRSAADIAEYGTKRADYRRLVRNIRWIQKYPGGDKKAEELVYDLLAKYRKRPALIEELEAL